VLAKVHDESTLKLRAVYLWAMHRLVQWLLPFSIAVVIASDKIITLLFTHEYIDAAAILKIVFVAFPFLSLQMLNSSILLTSSYPRNSLVLYAGTCIIQFILGWILVTRWGANGASLLF
jgi:O-antigen/teichoic acid export membrane protein